MRSLIALGLFATAVGSADAQDFSKVEIQTTPLGGGLYMLVGAGGNVGVSVGEDGVFLIDDQYAPLTPKIKAAIAAISNDPVRFVLNTHWHGDHTGGNANLAESGAVILAHDNVRARMSSEQLIVALDRKVPPSPRVALPVVTFPESIRLHLNGHVIEAIHVDPAHTDGDVFVRFAEADVLHMGDVYFSGRYPFFDRSSGGSFDGMIKAAQLALEISGEDTKIIPGHGPLSNRAELDAYLRMLVDVRDRVRGALDDGQSLEALITSRPSAPWDATYGGGFVTPEKFVTLVYHDQASRRTTPAP